MQSKSNEYLPSLGRLLSFAARDCTSLSERELAPHGITLAHWVVLTALWRQDRMTIGELAHYCRATNSVLTRTLDRMTAHGLVKREADPVDRRVIRVRLTKKAAKLSHLMDFYEDINRTLLRGFSKQEQRTLFALLERVIANSSDALDREASRTDGKGNQK